jgi:hypothetical protein
MLPQEVGQQIMAREPGSPIELREILMREPASLVIPGRPPSSFDVLYQEITDRLPLLTQSSSLVLRAKAYQRYTALLNDLGVANQSPKIVYGAKGGMLLFHISTDPDSVIQALLLNTLQNQPDGEVNWGRRCFGPGLACFTDPQIVNEQLMRTELNPQNVIVIESIGMDNQHEVVVEEGYLAFLTDWFLAYIETDPILSIGFKQIFRVFLGNFGFEVLRTTQWRLMAFYLSGLVIDLFCALNPQVSRLSYRREIQENLPYYSSFGYRRDTSKAFLNHDTLLTTVDHMLEVGNIPYAQREKTTSVIRKFLKRVQCIENQFIGSKYLDLSFCNTPNVKKFILFCMLLHLDDDFFGFLERNEITRQSNRLLQICDSWFVLYNTKDIFKYDERFGTNMGSNRIVTLGAFDPKIHTLLSSDEVKGILDKVE